jgi:hypothetical protein
MTVVAREHLKEVSVSDFLMRKALTMMMTIAAIITIADFKF